MVPVGDQSRDSKSRTRDRLEAMKHLRAMQADAMSRGLNYSQAEIDRIIKRARNDRKGRAE